MSFERMIGDPVAMLIAETKAEAEADEFRAVAQPFAYHFCGWVAVATSAYIAFQLIRAGARWAGIL